MDFQMTEKEQYILMRKRKKIKLRQLAGHLGCSIKLISLYENNESGMAEEKIKKYKDYIENH